MHRKVAHETESAYFHFSNGNILDISVNLVQYFVVFLGNSIFLHFPSISIKLMKIVSPRFEMCTKCSIY
ncbi:hypothetical protein T10_7218 [Trichinella papuae]|uniref:Uncharacterized protein n=1 Tax=Trichinella papuae TaxID=268474 RepID=A0A0V1MRC2_9BILA|nr:hypothetical protein T10_7218 [Trichinella papuae]